jgi:cell division protease FtsH
VTALRHLRRRVLGVGRGRLWAVVAALLVLNWIVASHALHQDRDATKISYSEFRDQVRAGHVDEVTSSGDTITGTFADDAPGGRAGTHFDTRRPAFADDGLLEMLDRHGVEVKADPEPKPPLWLTVLVGFGPALLIGSLLIVLMRRGTAMGRSRARRYDPTKRLATFDDVAGIDEAEEELTEIVGFLRDPERYRRVGAVIPRGVLLSGPPGTGKTLLARAVAGEASVPFYSLSASEFVELVVGVGASRVRHLFKSAKDSAPAIVFIDELDAIGRIRGGALGGAAHDEREQTLNQILTELDGFSGTEGVIVLAATNRPEILDPALLRPGRFDRRIVVAPPDRVGRTRILAVHTRDVPLAADVNLEDIAATTPGMVGADLKNLVNEAALTAARRGAANLSPADFDGAVEKIVLGAERRIAIPELERARTAYHEAGHALLTMLEPGADPLRKVSIVPRGQTLGSVIQIPERDRYGLDDAYLRGRITVALGGRAAEELVYGDVTTGAEADLELVTKLARQMVGRWGMSRRVGLVSVLPSSSDFYSVNADWGATSEATKELVDSEVRALIDECHSAAIERLERSRQRLDALAAALLEHETLDEAEAYAAIGLERSAPERVNGTSGPST